MHTVLMTGRDLNLLRNRKLLLERAGYRVLMQDAMSQLDQVSGSLDLLIVCHSLTRDECARVIGLANARWPHLPKLVLLTWQDHVPPGKHVARFFIFDGPEKLLALVHQLMPVHQLCAAHFEGVAHAAA